MRSCLSFGIGWGVFESCAETSSTVAFSPFSPCQLFPLQCKIQVKSCSTHTVNKHPIRTEKLDKFHGGVPKNVSFGSACPCSMCTKAVSLTHLTNLQRQQRQQSSRLFGVATANAPRAGKFPGAELKVPNRITEGGWES